MEKKRIVLISHNDLYGGAAIVTYRLMKALQALGHKADMLVFNKTGDDPCVHQLGSRPVRGWRFIHERIGIFARNGFNRRDLFKVSTAATGMNIHRHPLVKQADAVFVNWINQATVSLKEMQRLCKMGKKVVWTMHDMWCMTGICHHAHECERYKQQCGSCPFLGAKAAPDDLSHRTWIKKKKLYDTAGIQFVAVSNWAREKALGSSLLHDKDITVIPNAFPSNAFGVTSDRSSILEPRQHFNRTIVFGAANLEDPIKGLPYAIEALNMLYDEAPELAAGTVAIFFGAISDRRLFDKLRLPHIVCGTISDHAALHNLYTQSDVVLSTSLYETFPGTLIEGMSSGCVPITFGRGGQSDIVDHKVTGYIAEYLNPRDIYEGIKWAFTNRPSRQSQHDVIRSRFNADVIARRYLDLID